MRHTRDNHPTLITDAPESLDDEYDRRRKRYAIMMSLRALCVIAAALTYRVSWILALALVVGGAILPWCAVLLANDRPPKKARRRRGYYGAGSSSGKALESRQKALPPARPDQTVDGQAVNEPTPDDPTSDEPTSDEPRPDGSTVNGSTVNGSTVNGPTVNGPTVDRPAKPRGDSPSDDT